VYTVTRVEKIEQQIQSLSPEELAERIGVRG
jgi:hypothetical protein